MPPLKTPHSDESTISFEEVVFQERARVQPSANQEGMVNAKHGIWFKATRAGCFPCKRADRGADLMRGGDRLKEHISALSGAERLSSLVNLFSPLAGMCG